MGSALFRTALACMVFCLSCVSTGYTQETDPGVQPTPVTLFTTRVGKGELTPRMRFMQSLATEIFAEARVHSVEKVDSWPRAMAEVEHGGPAAMFPMTRTQAREDRFLWVGPISRTVWQLHTLDPDKAAITSLAEAGRQGAIGVAQNSARLTHLQAKPGLTIFPVPTYEAMARLLAADRISYMAMSRSAANFVFEEAGMDPNRLLTALTYRECFLYLALSKTTPADTIKKLQDATNRLKNSGRYVELRHTMSLNADPKSSFIRAMLNPENNNAGCHEEAHIATQ